MPVKGTGSKWTKEVSQAVSFNPCPWALDIKLKSLLPFSISRKNVLFRSTQEEPNNQTHYINNFWFSIGCLVSNAIGMSLGGTIKICTHITTNKAKCGKCQVSGTKYTGNHRRKWAIQPVVIKKCFMEEVTRTVPWKNERVSTKTLYKLASFTLYFLIANYEGNFLIILKPLKSLHRTAGLPPLGKIDPKNTESYPL